MGSTADPSPLGKEVLLILLPQPPSPEMRDRIAKRHPGLEIRFEASMTPDGGYLKAEDLPQDIWSGVTLLATNMCPTPALIPDVRFIQLSSAGADKWASHEKYKDENIVFCTANGVHPPQIAEWVIGTWLSHQHHFPQLAANQKAHKWDKLHNLRVVDSTACRMGILGYGAIGRQCARVAQAMGMEVYVYTRSEKATPESRADDSYHLPGMGDPEGTIPARWFHGAGREAINEFLAQDLDIVVLSLPLTPESRHIISSEQLAIMGASPKKTFLCNIARGGHVDQDALIHALETGLIRGAAIDVTDPEPLPTDHPLWDAPNLFLSPHVSWKTHDYFGRAYKILETNLEKLATGQRPINMMNKKLNY